jgi:hypothetical protein
MEKLVSLLFKRQHYSVASPAYSKQHESQKPFSAGDSAITEPWRKSGKGQTKQIQK